MCQKQLAPSCSPMPISKFRCQLSKSQVPPNYCIRLGLRVLLIGGCELLGLGVNLWNVICLTVFGFINIIVGNCCSAMRVDAQSGQQCPACKPQQTTLGKVCSRALATCPFAETSQLHKPLRQNTTRCIFVRLGALDLREGTQAARGSKNAVEGGRHFTESVATPVLA